MIRKVIREDCHIVLDLELKVDKKMIIKCHVKEERKDKLFSGIIVVLIFSFLLVMLVVAQSEGELLEGMEFGINGEGELVFHDSVTHTEEFRDLGNIISSVYSNGELTQEQIDSIQATYYEESDFYDLTTNVPGRNQLNEDNREKLRQLLYQKLENHQDLLNNLEILKKHLHNNFDVYRVYGIGAGLGNVKATMKFVNGNIEIKRDFDSDEKVFVIPRGYIIVDDPDKLILENKNSDEAIELGKTQDIFSKNKVVLKRSSRVEITIKESTDVKVFEEKTIKIIGVGDFYVQGKKFEAIRDAEFVIESTKDEYSNDVEMIKRARFKTTKKGVYKFPKENNRFNKDYEFDAEPGAEISIDFFDRRITAKNANLFIGEPSEHAIYGYELSILLDSKGGPEEIKYGAKGGNYIKDNVEYSSDEEFTIFFNKGRGDLKDYSGNAVSFYEDSEGKSVEYKGKLKVTNGLNYEGRESDSYVSFNVDENKFNIIGKGDVNFGNSEHIIEVVDGNVKLLKKNLGELTDAESFAFEIDSLGGKIRGIVDESTGMLQLFTSKGGVEKLAVGSLEWYEGELSDSEKVQDNMFAFIQEKLVELENDLDTEPREIDELRLALANAEVQRTKLKGGHLEEQIGDFREHLSKFKTDDFRQIGNYQLAEMLGKNIEDVSTGILKFQEETAGGGPDTNPVYDTEHYRTSINEFGEMVVTSYSLDGGITFTDLYNDPEKYSIRVEVSEDQIKRIKKLQDASGAVDILTNEAKENSKTVFEKVNVNKNSGYYIHMQEQASEMRGLLGDFIEHSNNNNDLVGSGNARIMLANVDKYLGNEKKAITELIKISEGHGLSHIQSEALKNLGLIYDSQGRQDKALEYLNTAINRDPENVNAFAARNLLKLKRAYLEQTRLGKEASDLYSEIDGAIYTKLPKSGFTEWLAGTLWTETGKVLTPRRTALLAEQYQWKNDRVMEQKLGSRGVQMLIQSSTPGNDFLYEFSQASRSERTRILTEILGTSDMGDLVSYTEDAVHYNPVFARLAANGNVELANEIFKGDPPGSFNAVDRDIMEYDDDFRVTKPVGNLLDVVISEFSTANLLALYGGAQAVRGLSAIGVPTIGQVMGIQNIKNPLARGAVNLGAQIGGGELIIETSGNVQAGIFFGELFGVPGKAITSAGKKVLRRSLKQSLVSNGDEVLEVIRFNTQQELDSIIPELKKKGIGYDAKTSSFTVNGKKTYAMIGEEVPEHLVSGGFNRIINPKQFSDEISDLLLTSHVTESRISSPLNKVKDSIGNRHYGDIVYGKFDSFDLEIIKEAEALLGDLSLSQKKRVLLAYHASNIGDGASSLYNIRRIMDSRANPSLLGEGFDSKHIRKLVGEETKNRLIPAGHFQGRKVKVPDGEGIFVDSLNGRARVLLVDEAGVQSIRRYPLSKIQRSSEFLTSKIAFYDIPPSPVEGMESMIDSLKDVIPPPKDWQSGGNAYIREVLNKMNDLGWSGRVINRFDDPGRMVTILKNNIRGPESVFVYHGTSTKFLSSMRQNGLDNKISGTVNPGYMREGVATTYASDIDLVFGFSELTTKSQGGREMVLRWRVDRWDGIDEKSVLLKEVGGSDTPVPPDLLEYSVDGGKNWQSVIRRPKGLDGFNSIEAEYNFVRSHGQARSVELSGYRPEESWRTFYHAYPKGTKPNFELGLDKTKSTEGFFFSSTPRDAIEAMTERGFNSGDVELVKIRVLNNVIQPSAKKPLIEEASSYTLNNAFRVRADRYNQFNDHLNKGLVRIEVD